jgi:hypothetical protein
LKNETEFFLPPGIYKDKRGNEYVIEEERSQSFHWDNEKFYSLVNSHGISEFISENDIVFEESGWVSDPGDASGVDTIGAFPKPLTGGATEVDKKEFFYKTLKHILSKYAKNKKKKLHPKVSVMKRMPIDNTFSK